jgi:ABC-2 type transport system permease protein
MIGMAAFWFDQSKSLIHLKWMSEGIFGGAWLPLYFFPQWLQIFAKFTPFYYWFFFPIELVLKKLSPSEITFGLAASVAWVIILKILTTRLWHKALYKYSAVGG